MPSHAALRLRTTADAEVVLTSCIRFVSSASFAGPRFGSGQQRRAYGGCKPAQAFADRFASAFERLRIAVELKGPVRAQFERVNFESELRGVNRLLQMTGVLCFDDEGAERGQPLLHDLCN